MVSKLSVCGVVIACIAFTHAYSGGAPVDVCEDMTPKHPATPQKSQMPYEMSVNSKEVSGGGVVKITISGKSGFKGFLLQVREGDNPVGKFLVSDSDKFIKTINCGKGEQNAATHKNSEDKNNLTIDWQAPAGLKGQVKVFVTVAEDGGTYWVRQGTASINLK